MRRVDETRAAYARDAQSLPEFLSALIRLARLQVVEGDQVRAERLVGEAWHQINDAESLSPEDSASYLGRAAFIFESIGNEDRAIGAYEAAIRIVREAGSEVHKDVASIYNNLGMLLKERGELDEAERHYERALAILEEVSGADSPEILSVYNNLGVLHYSRYKLEKALQQHERVLELRQSLYGEDSDHYDILQSLRNLAAVHKAMGNYNEASEYFARSNRAANVAAFEAPERESRSEIDDQGSQSVVG